MNLLSTRWNVAMELISSEAIVTESQVSRLSGISASVTIILCSSG